MFSRLVHPVSRVVAGCTCVAVLTALAGCTSDGPAGSTGGASPSESSSTGSAATLEAKPVPLNIRINKAAGRLKKPTRVALEKRIGRAISGYFDAALLGGEYPRTNFAKAFPTFTPGAVKQARRDRDLLTNNAIGGATAAITAKKKRARVAVVVPNKVAAGATANIHLVYIAEGDGTPDQEVTMTGRLLLTRAEGGWQIFGYDIARSVVPAEKGAK